MKKMSFIIAVVLIFGNCTNVNTNQNNESKLPSELQKFKDAIGKVHTEVPNAYNVSAYLEMTGADYMPTLINNPQNVNKYKETPYLAAVNLGIYNIDIVYQASYQKSEGAMLSYGAAKELAQYIGLGEVYDELFLQRIEEGINKNDSVIYKLNNALAKSETALNKVDQGRLFTALIIGANIEKLYILNNIIFNYNVELTDESKLLVLRQTLIILEEQIKELAVLTKLFESYKPETEMGAQVLTRMQNAIENYSKLKFRENIESLTPKQVFENTNLLEAFEQIKDIRKMITL